MICIIISNIICWSIITLSLLIILINVIFKFIVEPIGVIGVSMQPTLYHGDIVIVSKIRNKYKISDIVVSRQPNTNELVVKRVMEVKTLVNKNTLVWLQGDNSPESNDSRHYGWVDIKRLEGRVIKIWKKKNR